VHWGDDLQLNVEGATVLGQSQSGNRKTTILVITESGLKLLKLAGSGHAEVKTHQMTRKLKQVE
jgi:hypothetical protein